MISDTTHQHFKHDLGIQIEDALIFGEMLKYLGCPDFQLDGTDNQIIFTFIPHTFATFPNSLSAVE
jgi:hypothetical protein